MDRPRPEGSVVAIGDALMSVRAAIEVVAGGRADRVLIYAAEDGVRLLPAARALARAAGVRADAVTTAGSASLDIVIRGSPERG